MPTVRLAPVPIPIVKPLAAARTVAFAGRSGGQSLNNSNRRGSDASGQIHVFQNSAGKSKYSKGSNATSDQCGFGLASLHSKIKCCKRFAMA